MRRARWASGAVVLLVAAASLLLAGERRPQASRRAVELPRARDEGVAPPWRRVVREIPAASGERAAPAATPQEAQRADPFLVALPVKADSPLVVFEANALRHSRLGELVLACVRSREEKRLADLERETGIDPLRDVDRVAFLGDAVVVSGFFGHLRWGELAGPVERYGEARIFRRAGRSFGAWGDGIVVIAGQPEDVRRAIDQLEGRSPVPRTGIPEELSAGEIHGVLPAAAVRGLLGEGDLPDRLAALGGRIELTVNAMDDVAATVRVRGDAAGLSELARSVTAALARGREQAQGARDTRLAELLAGAAIVPVEGGFDVRLGIPADRLAAWFQGCERWGPREMP